MMRATKSNAPQSNGCEKRADFRHFFALDTLI